MHQRKIAKLHAEVYEKHREQLFFSLCKNTKDEQAFHIQYKFLHFAQPSLTRLREMKYDKIMKV